MALSSSVLVLLNRLGLTHRPSIWKLLAILFALLNLKNLPFAWHLRLLKSFIIHTRPPHLRLARALGPSALFAPMITASRSPLLECDYNLHKSNSTYFSDFDVARLEILTSLAGPGIDATRRELASEPGSFGIFLGGVHMNFRREIKPYEGFEMWTRLLSWDRKWFYGVTHFVKKGAVKPTGYLLQPWKKGGKTTTSDANEHDTNMTTNADATANPIPQPFIFASGISKYVFKKGRLTIPPERVFRNAGLLPPKPAEHVTPPMTETPNVEGAGVDSVATDATTTATTVADTLHVTAAGKDADTNIITPENASEILAKSLDPFTSKSSQSNPLSHANGKREAEWTWERVESERVRGLRLASMFNGLQDLNGEFVYEGGDVLGVY